MRKAWISVGLAAVFMLVFFVPATSSASSTRTVRLASLNLNASHGYDAYIFALHQTDPRRHASVYLSLEKGDASASYQARALFTKRHLKASLGQFGRINLRFGAPRRGSSVQLRPRRREAPASPGAPAAAKAAARARDCAVLIPNHRRAYRGRIRFEGEAGFSRIRVNRGTGIEGSSKVSCSSGGGSGHRVHETLLTAEAGPLSFIAAHYDRWPRRSYLYALQSETVGRVKVERSAGSHRGAVFDFNPGFSTAHVEPGEGSLFGSADFAAPGQWTGDLTASFPGEPDVPLTGPDFKARLKHF